VADSSHTAMPMISPVAHICSYAGGMTGVTISVRFTNLTFGTRSVVVTRKDGSSYTSLAVRGEHAVLKRRGPRDPSAHATALPVFTLPTPPAPPPGAAERHAQNHPFGLQRNG
jgi:hypothetical protein